MSDCEQCKSFYLELERLRRLTPNGTYTLNVAHEEEIRRLKLERTEAEAKRRAAALLRRWANDLEAPRDLSGGDPRLCSYCGHPTNSSTCQRSHP